MATFTANEYFLGRVPDISTIIPGFNVDMAVNAARALYWTNFFPNQNPVPAYADDVLTERRKVLVALRAVVSILPVAQQILKPKVIEAHGGPAGSKFEERFKLYKLMADLWQKELTLLENQEGISFELLPTVPAFRLALSHSCDEFNVSGVVYSRDTTFVRVP